ncbi:hypothetical protein KKF34_02130 [Myxococcota bacterium]|nr:hypothetical protein [Myxococcota bacterium]MBU1379817.1 hypothetical protein [Myxococcota bacterium]MBU1495659.1 hypothetical protein [Myxococcota bacterium]
MKSLKIVITSLFIFAAATSSCKEKQSSGKDSETKTVKPLVMKAHPSTKTAEKPTVKKAEISVASGKPSSLKICSFNIKWLGHFKDRENSDLASVVSPCDIVVVQELVAAPTCPAGYEESHCPAKAWKQPAQNGAKVKSDIIKGDAETDKFVKAMAMKNFRFFIASKDTGKKANSSSPQSEWPIVFYKANKVRILPEGSIYIDTEVTLNKVYSYVPHTFSFKSVDGKTDFVLISVHLTPNKSTGEQQVCKVIYKPKKLPENPVLTSGKDKRQPSKNDQSEKRKSEINAILSWIEKKIADGKEKDYIILGDMNLEKTECRALAQSLKNGWKTLNSDCESTVTSKGNKPFDHIFVNQNYSTEAMEFSFFNLRELMPPEPTIDVSPTPVMNPMTKTAKQPRGAIAMGTSTMSPKSVKEPVKKPPTFYCLYSDHNPIYFEWRYTRDDD